MVRMYVSFTGNNGFGSISIAEVKAGDLVLAVSYTGASNVNGQDGIGNFSKIVLVDGALPQIVNADLSTHAFAALIEREVLI